MNGITDFWYPVAVALAGFVVRSLRFGVHSVKSGMSGAVCAVFSGIIAFWMLDGSQLEDGIRYAVVGLCGYSGGIVLDAALYRLMRIIKGDRQAIR